MVAGFGEYLRDRIRSRRQERKRRSLVPGAEPASRAAMQSPSWVRPEVDTQEKATHLFESVVVRAQSFCVCLSRSKTPNNEKHQLFHRGTTCTTRLRVTRNRRPGSWGCCCCRHCINAWCDGYVSIGQAATPNRQMQTVCTCTEKTHPKTTPSPNNPEQGLDHSLQLAIMRSQCPQLHPWVSRRATGQKKRNTSRKHLTIAREMKGRMRR